MHAGGIAVTLRVIWEHGIDYFGEHAGGGGVVEVNRALRQAVAG
jgi:hypothetical protein